MEFNNNYDLNESDFDLKTSGETREVKPYVTNQFQRYDEVVELTEADLFTEETLDGEPSKSLDQNINPDEYLELTIEELMDENFGDGVDLEKPSGRSRSL